MEIAQLLYTSTLKLDHNVGNERKSTGAHCFYRPREQVEAELPHGVQTRHVIGFSGSNKKYAAGRAIQLCST